MCTREWIYHVLTPQAAGAAASSGSGAHWRLTDNAGLELTNATSLEGKNVEVRITKHGGDFYFMALASDRPPKRLQPPFRHVFESAYSDSMVLCNINAPNSYWLAIYGGEHCSVYDLDVVELSANDSRCASGEFVLAQNEATSTGYDELRL